MPIAPCARRAGRHARCSKPASSWSACRGPRARPKAVILSRARRDGLEGYRVGLGDASLYPSMLDGQGVGAASRAARPRAPHARLRRPRAGDRGAETRPRRAAALLGVPQRRGGPDVLDPAGPAADRHAGGARSAARAVAERVIFDLGLSRSLGYYTGAVFEVYDQALGSPIGGGGRYDDLLGRFGRSLPRRRLGAQRGAAAHRAGGGAPPVRHEKLTTLAVPRGALFAHTLDALDGLGVDTREVRANDRKLLFEDVGIVTMRPSDVPTYVEAGAADIGITGKDVLSEQSERDVYELLDLGFGRCLMVLATVAGEDPRCGGAPPARRHADRDEVPEDRRPPLRADGPPGRDRRGQGLRRAGAPHGARGRHRGPHGDGHDAARERPRRAGGDRRGHGAADRQPGLPQAQGAAIDDVVARLRAR